MGVKKYLFGAAARKLYPHALHVANMLGATARRLGVLEFTRKGVLPGGVIMLVRGRADGNHWIYLRAAAPTALVSYVMGSGGAAQPLLDLSEARGGYAADPLFDGLLVDDKVSIAVGDAPPAAAAVAAALRHHIDKGNDYAARLLARVLTSRVYVVASDTVVAMRPPRILGTGDDARLLAERAESWSVGSTDVSVDYVREPLADIAAGLALGTAVATVPAGGTDTVEVEFDISPGGTPLRMNLFYDTFDEGSESASLSSSTSHPALPMLTFTPLIEAVDDPVTEYRITAMARPLAPAVAALSSASATLPAAVGVPATASGECRPHGFEIARADAVKEEDVVDAGTYPNLVRTRTVTSTDGSWHRRYYVPDGGGASLAHEELPMATVATITEQYSETGRINGVDQAPQSWSYTVTDSGGSSPIQAWSDAADGFVQVGTYTVGSEVQSDSGGPGYPTSYNLTFEDSAAAVSGLATVYEFPGITVRSVFDPDASTATVSVDGGDTLVSDSSVWGAGAAGDVHRHALNTTFITGTEETTEVTTFYPDGPVVRFDQTRTRVLTLRAPRLSARALTQHYDGLGGPAANVSIGDEFSTLALVLLDGTVNVVPFFGETPLLANTVTTDSPEYTAAEALEELRPNWFRVVVQVPDGVI